MSNSFSILSAQALDAITLKRPGETKLGECVQLCAIADSWQESLTLSDATFVLLGIPEDIGVRANGGIGGAATAWQPALQSLMNIQSTPQFSGAQLLVLGSFDFTAWQQASQEMSVGQLRELVAQIDDIVNPIITAIVRAGKIPIVIGGGHNNAYPLLKGASKALGYGINCINLDAHSDYRIQEGRHSGNGFRYAKDAGYLSHYAMVGLHQNYNSITVMADIVADSHINYSYYEDIFLEQQLDFAQAVLEAINFTDGVATGIELDLDSIQNVLSSAATPAGISVLHARQYVHLVAQKTSPVYLHLAEGATSLANGRADATTGKLIAYLVSDFIKAHEII